MVYCFFFHQMGKNHAFLNYFSGKWRDKYNIMEHDQNSLGKILYLKITEMWTGCLDRRAFFLHAERSSKQKATSSTSTHHFLLHKGNRVALHSFHQFQDGSALWLWLRDSPSESPVLHLNAFGEDRLCSSSSTWGFNFSLCPEIVQLVLQNGRVRTVAPI